MTRKHKLAHWHHHNAEARVVVIIKVSKSFYPWDFLTEKKQSVMDVEQMVLNTMSLLAFTHLQLIMLSLNQSQGLTLFWTLSCISPDLRNLFTDLIWFNLTDNCAPWGLFFTLLLSLSLSTSGLHPHLPASQLLPVTLFNVSDALFHISFICLTSSSLRRCAHASRLHASCIMLWMQFVCAPGAGDCIFCCSVEPQTLMSLRTKLMSPVLMSILLS